MRHCPRWRLDWCLDRHGRGYTAPGDFGDNPLPPRPLAGDASLKHRPNGSQKVGRKKCATGFARAFHLPRTNAERSLKSAPPLSFWLSALRSVCSGSAGLRVSGCRCFGESTGRSPNLLTVGNQGLCFPTLSKMALSMRAGHVLFSEHAPNPHARLVRSVRFDRNERRRDLYRQTAANPRPIVGRLAVFERSASPTRSGPLESFLRDFATVIR